MPLKKTDPLFALKVFDSFPDEQMEDDELRAMATVKLQKLLANTTLFQFIYIKTLSFYYIL